MRRRSRRGALALCVSFSLFQLAGCFSERSETFGPGGDQTCDVPVSALGPGKAVVAIRGYAFLPDTLRISAGTTVTWVNCDDLAGTDAHTTTSDVTGLWSSPLFANGETYARAFGAPGEFHYHCQPHPAMRGMILVQ